MAEAPLGLSGLVAYGGEDAFDWVCRSDVFPMFGWEVVEGQENGTVHGLQADDVSQEKMAKAQRHKPTARSHSGG